jgi:hypothetical protein
MKAKATILTILLGFALAGSSMRAANYVVEPGQDIQPAVDQAKAGDVVIIRGGTYLNQTVTVTKPIRLVREKGTTVTIGGSLTFKDVNGTMVLRDFILDKDGINRTKLVIENCDKFGLERITLTGRALDPNYLGTNVTVEDSTVVIRDCVLPTFNFIAMQGQSEVEVINTSLRQIRTRMSSMQMHGCSFTNLMSDHPSGFISLRNCTASEWVSFACPWEAHGCTIKGHLNSNSSHSKLFRSTVEGDFSHTDASKDCVIFRSTIGQQNNSSADKVLYGASLLSKANRTWVTYSTFDHAKLEGGTEAHFIGNVISQYGSFLLSIKEEYVDDLGKTKTQDVRHESESNHGIHLDGASCKVTIANNHFSTSQPYSSPDLAPRGNGINILKARKVSVLNNLFRNWDTHGHCVYAVKSPADGLFIRGNVFWRSTAGPWEKQTVRASKGPDRNTFNSAGVLVTNPDLCSHNYFQFLRRTAVTREDENGGEVTVYMDVIDVDGGIAENDNLTGADLGFVDDGNDWRLTADSILKNKGPTGVEHKDHDGSRNDVGLHGGHLHDPNGTTSDKPVVLSADQSALRITKGGAPILIKARAAVSTP